MKNKKAEEARLRYLYRDMIIRKELRLPLDAAVKLIGPDCAYHLYSILDLKKGSKTGRHQSGKRAGSGV